MNTEVFENYESSVRSYCRRFPTVFKKSKGAFMYDENGEKYIDFFCGAGAVNYGHNNDYIKPKLIEYIEPSYVKILSKKANNFITNTEYYRLMKSICLYPFFTYNFCFNTSTSYICKFFCKRFIFILWQIKFQANTIRKLAIVYISTK